MEERQTFLHVSFLESAVVACNVTVVVLSSASFEIMEIGAGDMQPASVKPRNISTASTLVDVKTGQSEETFCVSEGPRSVEHVHSVAGPLTESVSTSLSQSSLSSLPPADDMMEAGDAKMLQQKTEQVAALQSQLQQVSENTDNDIVSHEDTSVQTSRKSTYATDAAVYKQEARSTNADAAGCCLHKSDSASMSETSTVSQAGDDTVFYTPPSHISDSKTTNNSVSPSEQQHNQHSLEDTATAASERKVVVYKRSDSSAAIERRDIDSECSLSELNAKVRVDEDGLGHHSERGEKVTSDEQLGNRERDSDDNDDDDDDTDDDVNDSESRADEVLDKGAADEKTTDEPQGNRSEMTTSTIQKKKRKKKKKSKKNKQQNKQAQSAAVAKSVTNSTVTSEVNDVESLPITRPPARKPEVTAADSNTDNRETGATDSAAECSEHSVASPMRDNVNSGMSQLSVTPATETVPPAEADTEASGSSDAVNHQRNQETDKRNEQKHVKTGALGAGADADGANVSHTRSHNVSKAEKRTDGNENVKSEHRQLNADRESENKATQMDTNMENRPSDTNTSDATSHQGKSYAQVCTYCIFDII